MRILIVSVLFLLSLVAIIPLSRAKTSFRFPLVLLCILIMIITAFLNIIWITWYRTERGAELFLQNAISDLNDGKLPPLISDIPESNKIKIENLVNNLPRETYTIEYNDSWGRTQREMFEFYIQYDNGLSFLCLVEASDTFMSFFISPKYKLVWFEKTNGKKTNPASDVKRHADKVCYHIERYGQLEVQGHDHGRDRDTF